MVFKNVCCLTYSSYQIFVHIVKMFIGIMSELNLTRMWANAQRDGRPAEHRWRPLFNAAKFG